MTLDQRFDYLCILTFVLLAQMSKEIGKEDVELTTAEIADVDPETGVKRGLRTRHVSMIALAGIIGSGLIVGSGNALELGGPASTLICVVVVGFIVLSVMQSIGETVTLSRWGWFFNHREPLCQSSPLRGDLLQLLCSLDYGLSK